jgi:mannitol-specific phosphotransferase system IIBC component
LDISFIISHIILQLCIKNKDDQLDVDISRKTKENDKNSKQFSDKSESANEQDCNGGRISLDENLNGLKNSTNGRDKLHETEIFTGLGFFTSCSLAFSRFSTVILCFLSTSTEKT